MAAALTVLAAIVGLAAAIFGLAVIAGVLAGRSGGPDLPGPPDKSAKPGQIGGSPGA